MRRRSISASPVRVSQRELIDLAADCRGLSLERLRTPAQRSGDHRAPLLGRGMEFEDVRNYQMGDDPRHIDWRVTARTGEPHTKVFREERERPVILVLDLRASMHFATTGVYKSVKAARLGMALAWLAQANGDRVGGFVFSESHHAEIKPKLGRRSVLRLAHAIVEAPVWEPSQKEAATAGAALTNALRGLQRVARKGALIALHTDARHWDDLALQVLGKIAARNNLLIFHHCDPLEARLPPPASYRVASQQSIYDADFSDPRTRDRHRAEFEQRASRLASLKGAHTQYFRIQTDQDEWSLLRELFGAGSA